MSDDGSRKVLLGLISGAEAQTVEGIVRLFEQISQRPRIIEP